jgi:hypothetical protein
MPIASAQASDAAPPLSTQSAGHLRANANANASAGTGRLLSRRRAGSSTQGAGVVI